MNTIQYQKLSLAEQFIIHSTKGTGEFEGKPGFSDKLKEIIRSASDLNIGRKVLSDLLKSGKPINILEGQQSSHLNLFFENNLEETSFKKNHCISDTIINIDKSTITLNFDHKGYYIGLNENKEREIILDLPVNTFIHEAIHLIHLINDIQAYRKRGNTPSLIPDMDNQEEEFTISGRISDNNELVFYSENDTLRELNLPERINHRGGRWHKSKLKSIQIMIKNRAIGSIRKKLLQPEEKIKILAYADEVLISCLIEIENTTKTDKRKELLMIINFLIDEGFKSNKALEYATQKLNWNSDPIKREEWIQIIAKLHQAGNYTLEYATQLASEERDPIKQKEWIQIIEQFIKKIWLENFSSLFTLNNTYFNTLENAVKIIQSIEDSELRQQWIFLFQPLIEKTLEHIVSLKKKFFCDSVKLLINTGYCASLLELFVSGAHPSDIEFLTKVKSQLKHELEIVQLLIEKQSSEKDMEDYLESMCPDSQVARLRYFYLLVRAINFIAVSGNTFSKLVKSHKSVEQLFEKIINACKSIYKKRNIQQAHDEKIEIEKMISSIIAYESLKSKNNLAASTLQVNR